MASIKRYKTANGTAWRVQYRSPDGRSRTKQGFRTKDLAQRWADENAVAVRTGTWINPQDQATTVRDLGQKWLPMQTHLKPSTARTTEQAWRVHVEPVWGDWQIGKIKPSDVQAWVSSLDRSGSTVRRMHACLAQILDMAVGDGMLTTNPARGVKLPRKAQPEHIYLTIDQLGQLAAECTTHGELVWLLGTTGLRWGEAAALRCCDVDLHRGRLRVERNAVTVGGDVHIGTPKTHERRTVAVPRAVMGMLEQVMTGKAPEDLLWCRADGEPLRVPTQRHWYYRALGRVRARHPDFPRVSPHGLRHVAAGLLINAGANVKVVQRQLGHASAAMTLDQYASLWDDGLDVVASTMDEMMSECRGIVVE